MRIVNGAATASSLDFRRLPRFSGVVWNLEAAGMQKWQHDDGRKDKSKNFPNMEKAKTGHVMTKTIQFGDKVSRSRSKHEGESSASVCDRLNRTRVIRSCFITF
jgi:hypothetical protein